jgi:hypothetical protein
VAQERGRLDDVELLALGELRELRAVDELPRLLDRLAHEAQHAVEVLRVLLLDHVADVFERGLALDLARDFLLALLDLVDLGLGLRGDVAGRDVQAAHLQQLLEAVLADRVLLLAVGEDVDDQPVAVALQRVLGLVDEAVQVALRRRGQVLAADVLEQVEEARAAG